MKRHSVKGALRRNTPSSTFRRLLCRTIFFSTSDSWPRAGGSALKSSRRIDFEEAVNVTLGLPIVRTSPDHGTAYNIAGTGKARSVSMQRAVALAVEMVSRRQAAAGEPA